MLRAAKALAIASDPRSAFASGLTAAGAEGFLPEGGVWLLLLAMAALVVHLSWRLRRAEKERDLARQRANEIGDAGREAGRLALVGRLASSIAHEINNPLAFVKANVLYLCRLRADSPQIPPDDLAQLLDDTRDGVDRIQQIASDLRAISRQAPEIAEPCSVRELVERSARIAHARSRGVVDLELGLPAELIFITGDPHRLTHLLVNVLLNAIEAVEETGPQRPPRIAVSCEAREETVCIAVEDNGPGVPRELRERIFEPFFTTKAARRAPGLGLSLSREYLSRCGGEIRVEDGAGGCGARFCVCLVRAGQPPAEALEGARTAL